MNAWIPKRLIAVAALAAGFGGLAGCGAYYTGGFWQSQPVSYAAPAPYANEYYYDASAGAYYCYYPTYGWRFCPGPPPTGAVFWSGPRPVYLPPPPMGYATVSAPAVGLQFFFDPGRRVYYYRGNDHHWRYYPGRPPGDARFWQGPSPRELPHPPINAPQWQGRVWQRQMHGNHGRGRGNGHDHGHGRGPQQRWQGQ